jgi:hypothetical protein
VSSNGYKKAYVRLRSATNGRWFAHPELRAKLIEDAAKQETSMTEVVLMVLCKHLKIQHVPSGRRSSADDDQELLNLRIPQYVFLALRQKYPAEDYQDSIRRILCAHYKLPWGGKAREAAVPA